MALSPPSTSTPNLQVDGSAVSRILDPIRQGEDNRLTMRALNLGLLSDRLASSCGIKITLWKNGQQLPGFVTYHGLPEGLNNWIKENHPGCVQGAPFYNLSPVRGL